MGDIRQCLKVVVRGRNCAIILEEPLKGGYRDMVEVVKPDGSCGGKWNDHAGVRGRHFLPYTVAPRCPGFRSTGSPAVPDEIPRILNFFTPKPDSLSRIIRCPGQISWILAIRDIEVRLY